MTTSIYIPNKNSLEYRTKQFFKKAKEVHKGKYDLSKVLYKSIGEKVIFICSIHGEFTQTPQNHLKGHGCDNDSKRLDTKCFIEKSNIIHNNIYIYNKTKYKRSDIEVIIECKDHGEFTQRPNNHLVGHGCNECANNNLTATNDEFIEKSNIIHNNIYIYNKTKYEKSNKEVIIKCVLHGDFYQTPNNHLSRQGCPKCSNVGYSKVAIKWLDSFNNPNIQHAENGGEFKIPNTKYKADGYDKETNTVYEFHGDVYHGNPNLYEDTDHCHPFDKNITAGELYRKTINREELIRSLGYNLIVIWESDYILKMEVIITLNKMDRYYHPSV